jgi:putative molybdenum carrier protein
LNKIISGGQTGADMGGLLAARELGLDCGGVAPKGWLTENGPQEARLRSFGLIECEEEGYPARTRRNVAEADGTLLVGQYETGGSGLTYKVAAQLKKPVFLLPFPNPADLLDDFRSWLAKHDIRTLNVAGNRESQSPGIGEFTRKFLLRAVKR